MHSVVKSNNGHKPCECTIDLNRNNTDNSNKKPVSYYIVCNNFGYLTSYRGRSRYQELKNAKGNKKQQLLMKINKVRSYNNKVTSKLTFSQIAPKNFLSKVSSGNSSSLKPTIHSNVFPSTLPDSLSFAIKQPPRVVNQLSNTKNPSNTR
jgi:hypothetical protein